MKIIQLGATRSARPAWRMLGRPATLRPCSDHTRGLATQSLPQRARVVVVGGGIIGNSVAYHLAKGGCNDVVLLERHQITSGTTWHAAGLMVTFGSTSETSTELRKYTKALYSSLEAETGQATGFMPVGFIELATDEGRLEEYRRVAAFNRRCGVEVQEIGPADVKSLFPLCKVDDVLRGFYVADDGRVNPVDATMALAKGARMYGARIFENTPVAGITQDNGRVTGVTTACGHHIEAEVVVNCAGMWARQFAEVAGVTVPNQATEHYYMLTGTMPDVQPDWPVVEDPASHAYIRPEGGGLMVGLFEPVAAAWNIKRIPSDFNFGEIEPDWERMTPFLDTAMARVPRVSEAGIKKFFCGPESFTPDLQPIVGEAPELRNYFVAAGLNSIGILTGGGIGRLMAHWITHGTPDMDVTGFNIDRLHKYQANPEYRAHRVIESLGRVYKCHYPSQTLKTARNAKLSPLHNRLQQKNPYFISVSGWESPSWYAPAGEVAAITEHTWGRENWFPYWQAEHQACREHVVLFDMSFMSKFLVQGRDAGKILNYLSTANVDANHGEMTYTQWLNGEGKLEADLTVAKLAESDAYLVVATDTMHRHVETWMRRAITRDHHAFITDVTGAYAMLSLQGPQARAVLQAATSADISHTAFPFRAFREIDVGYARVLCARMTYVGELGFELYVPAEQAVHVYDRLMAAGNIRSAGLRALGSLRMEKAYRDYGHDLDNTDTLLEAGLGFTCAFDKPDGFRGQAAVMKQKAGPGLTKRLVQVLCSDPEPLMFHAEVIRRNGKVVGNVRAASYGHTLGGAVGLGLVESDEPIIPAWLSKAEWTVEIGNQQFPAQISLRPFYDPTGQKIRQ